MVQNQLANKALCELYKYLRCLSWGWCLEGTSPNLGFLGYANQWPTFLITLNINACD